MLVTVLRHAEAVPPGSAADSRRELSRRGLADAGRVGAPAALFGQLLFWALPPEYPVQRA
jgi:phosphohistidine phosphatase SixA